MFSMWDHLSPDNLLDLQRREAVRVMGEKARKLFTDGYTADADRVLDEIVDRFPHRFSSETD